MRSVGDPFDMNEQAHVALSACNRRRPASCVSASAILALNGVALKSESRRTYSRGVRPRWVA